MACMWSRVQGGREIKEKCERKEMVCQLSCNVEFGEEANEVGILSLLCAVSASFSFSFSFPFPSPLPATGRDARDDATIIET